LQIRAAETEIRGHSTDNAPGVTGYGSVAGQSTTIEGYFSDWDEEVSHGAWTKTIAESARIMSMFNHDPGRLLGATDAGTLTLSEDVGGLLYDVDINSEDPMAMSVHAQVGRGDVRGSSVWFQVVREQWSYPNDENDLERPHRLILEGRLFETGPVTWPAFDQTTAAARSAASLETVLRTAGVRDKAKRSALAFSALTDPDSAAEQLAGLMTRNPELRDAVCQCAATNDLDATRAAPDGAPELDTPPDAGHLSATALHVARARLQLLRR